MSDDKQERAKWMRKTPSNCAAWWCKNDKYLPKTHGYCPMHYQRLRRNETALSEDAEEILEYLYTVLGPSVHAFIKSIEEDWDDDKKWQAIESVYKNMTESGAFVGHEGEELPEYREMIPPQFRDKYKIP